MFGANNYFLGIPVPAKIGDELNNLIIKIAEKEPSLGLSNELLSQKIEVKGEFHVTLGVFHTGFFESNRALFKKLVSYLKNNKQHYEELKNLLYGACIIRGIGFEKDAVEYSDIVYASVESSQVPLIREKIHALLKIAGIDETHFTFTDPHITLFTKKEKKDIHGIRKLPKVPVGKYGVGEIQFDFRTVAFYSGGRVLLCFGPQDKGNPSTKLKTMISSALQSTKQQSGINYNWGPLFKSKFGSQAKQIKELVLKGGLIALDSAFSKEQSEEIKKLIG